MSWIEIKISLPESLTEIMGSHLFDLGCSAIQENKDGISVYVEDKDLKTWMTDLNEYIKIISRQTPNLPQITITTHPMPDENWKEKYKEFYRAQPLTHHFYLIPSWEKDKKIDNEYMPIYMEPGQAFGTGLHPSTKLSARLIEQAVELYLFRNKIKFLDVGTGTGILAIVANKMGVKDISAIDNDPVAIEVAEENCVLNQSKFNLLSTDPLSSFKEKFDMIVSNILLETHYQLAKEYRRLLKPGGQLILSGLLGYQKNEIDQIMKPLGFQQQSSLYLQEWAAYTYSWRDG